MSSRRIFREYAKFKGREAKSFVKIETQFYQQDDLQTMSNDNAIEHTTIDYREMTHWLIKNHKTLFTKHDNE